MSEPADGRSNPSAAKTASDTSALGEKPEIIELDFKSFSPSLVLSLIGIPLLLIVMIVSIVRLKKQGKVLLAVLLLPTILITIFRMLWWRSQQKQTRFGTFVEPSRSCERWL